MTGSTLTSASSCTAGNPHESSSRISAWIRSARRNHSDESNRVGRRHDHSPVRPAYAAEELSIAAPAGADFRRVDDFDESGAGAVFDGGDRSGRGRRVL